MPDFIGNIAVPEIVASGVFPLVPDFPLDIRRDHEVVVHQFGSGNAKIEQRMLVGTGARRFTIRKQWLRDADRIALRNFWESKYGPYGAFTYNAPNDNGVGTTPVICRFANEPLSWEMVADWACSLGVTLIEIPQTSPSYPLNHTVNRFPPAALQAALLAQVQEIIPLVRIQPLQPATRRFISLTGAAPSAANSTRRASSSLTVSRSPSATSQTRPTSRSATPTV